MVKAVFLDRDGVLTAHVRRGGRAVAPASLADFRILPGSADAVSRLKEAGFVVIVVTNQPDVGAGTTERAAVEAMHEELRRLMPIDDIKVCYHVDADNCGCRKPKAGMLLDSARERRIDLAASYMVGDRWRDTEAGRAAGCLTIDVESDAERDRWYSSDAAVRTFSEAVAYILKRENMGSANEHAQR